MGELLILLALILLNGVFAMSEVALISARKSALSSQAKAGNRAARRALSLANNPERFLATVQIGITVIGILTGVYSSDILADDLSQVLLVWGVSARYAHFVAQTMLVVGVTYLTVIFGELVPKKIGLSIAERIAQVVARPMHLLSLIASPFVWLLSRSTSLVFRLLGVHSTAGRVTEQEIKTMVQEGIRDGEIQEVEQEIVERVFLMGDLKVGSLMTHRSEVVWLEVGMSAYQVKLVLESQLHEHYPVAKGSLDVVEGVVSLKDLILALDRPNFSLHKLLHTPTYLYEHFTAYSALEKMKEQGLSRILISDEFGAFQGILTLKDLLEGFVGSMDGVSQEPDIIPRQEGAGWLVDGRCSFHNFLSYFDKEHPVSAQYNTVGGLVLNLMEHIPCSGERVAWEDFSFEVVDMDGVRIDKVLVTRLGE